ncbi:esterase E4-like [Calliopsis andreniformis]|uniref:esterase E4-like n=1 Tax=Calliopsis andreniformis TaxID=337506 RepID=UPI003FCD862F
MKNTLVVFFCVICVVTAQNVNSEQPVVSAPTGQIRGSILTSRLGKKIYSFRGVRYAEPPTGPRRFQPPVPAQDWQNVFDASEEGPSCPQRTGKLMSEDCLRLNVYTTKLPSRNENVSRPVMVFIHPGGFYGFSGQSSLFGPEYIMDKDIVLITINYRLGALGFISTGDSAAPGNLGLKDQVAAFRWIQRNIAAFGGDPNSVTLCGDSAGSFSIILHMVSPMSKNLFHRAISMSAAPFTADVYFGVSLNGQKQLAIKQAEALNCPTDTTDSMMRCLSTKPVEDFPRTLNSLFEWYETPILLWKPTVEPEVPGVERFLTAHPYDLIKQGRYQQIPIMLGVTEEEFGGIVALYEESVKLNGTAYRELDSNWTTIAPIVFQYPGNTPRSNYISRELRRFYFQNQPINSATKTQLAHVYADSIIIFPMYRLAKLLAATSCQPVYFYKFTFEGRYSFFMQNGTTPYGASHQDDLQYLFFIKDLFPYFESNAPEIPMVEILTSIWSNFVGTGEPISKNDNKLRGVTWAPLVPGGTNFLDINLRPTMKTSFFPERMQTWERLFPLPSRSQNVKG